MMMQRPKKCCLKNPASEFEFYRQERWRREHQTLNQSIRTAKEGAAESFKNDDHSMNALSVLDDEKIRQATLIDSLYQSKGSVLGMAVTSPRSSDYCPHGAKSTIDLASRHSL
jgi:hypothetical protein